MKARKKESIDLEMESPEGGEDYYEDYEPGTSVLYENTNLQDPNGTIPRRPPVPPKPQDVSATPAHYTDYRNQEEYLVPKKTSRDADDEKEAKEGDDSVQVTFENKTPLYKRRRFRIAAIVMAIFVAFILGCLLLFVIMYFIPWKYEASDMSPAMAFIVGNQTGRISLCLTPQNEDTSVSIDVVNIPEFSYDTDTTKLAYTIDIKLGESVIWDNRLVYGRALTRKITSNGDVTTIMGMSSPDIPFNGDTTLLLPVSAMARDFTLVFDEPVKTLDYLCHIFSGESVITKVSITHPSHVNISTGIGDKIKELDAYSVLSLSLSGNVYSGLKITSDNPISVIVAKMRNAVPLNMETVYPTNLLGKDLYIPEFKGSGNYTTEIAIVAISNDTILGVAGSRKKSTQMKSGEVMRVDTEAAAAVTCSKACSVVAFIQKSECNKNSRKAMVAIPPEQLFLTGKVYFSADLEEVQYPDINLAIVIENGQTNTVDIKLNGKIVNATWRQFSDGKYLWASIKSIIRGTNSLDSKGLKYMAYLYGIDCVNSYGTFAHVIGVNI